MAQREGFGASGAIPTRQNNPLDLRHGPNATHSSGDPNGIGWYATADLGWQDAERQLALYAQRGMTLQDMVAVFAPPGDGNDTAEYLSYVCAQLGMQPTDTVAEALQLPAQHFTRLDRPAGGCDDAWRPRNSL
jgi:hypothetical protein